MPKNEERMGGMTGRRNPSICIKVKKKKIGNILRLQYYSKRRTLIFKPILLVLIKKRVYLL